MKPFVLYVCGHSSQRVLALVAPISGFRASLCCRWFNWIGLATPHCCSEPLRRVSTVIRDASRVIFVWFCGVLLGFATTPCFPVVPRESREWLQSRARH